MRISFDLDGTLICLSEGGLYDLRLPPLVRGFGVEEQLRLGAYELFRDLRERGWEIFIYTNSYRGKQELLDWFDACGMPVDDVLNQQLHEKKREEVGTWAKRPTKFPPWFGIDLHVDDLSEIHENGIQHGFAVLLISATDPDWARMILEAVDQK